MMILCSDVKFAGKFSRLKKFIKHTNPLSIQKTEKFTNAKLVVRPLALYNNGELTHPKITKVDILVNSVLKSVPKNLP